MNKPSTVRWLWKAR